MGEVVPAIEHVTDKCRLKAHLSLAGLGIAGGLGIVGIIATVKKVDGDLAVFIGGVAALTCSVGMITNWGASAGHADLARLAGVIGDQITEVEQIERATGSAVVIALDELRERRHSRNRG